jgi:hypothetical protein
MKVNSYSAIASAFDNHCAKLKEENSEQILCIGSQLAAALGSDVHFLAQMIPNL